MRFYVNSSPIFQPAMRLVTAITRSSTAQVTTSTDHDYRTGDIVRIYVPKWYGMRRADRMQGEITVTGDDTFTIDIDTTGFNAFSAPTAPIPWYEIGRAHV